MSKTKTSAAIINIQGLRLSFPYIFEPGAYEPGDTPAFSARFIFDEKTPKGQRKRMREVMDSLTMETWGKPLDSFTRDADRRICLRDGSDMINNKTNKTLDGYGPGTWFISARSAADKPPFVGKIHKGDVVEITPEEGLIYPGCRVHVKLRLFTYDHPKNGRRVCAQIKAVIFAGHDEPFGDKRTTAEDLEDMKGFESEDTAPKAKNRRPRDDDEED